jgi:amino acid transporter
LSAQPLSWDAFTSGALGTGVMFAVFGFIGFEATAVFRAEARHPDVTIPRATYAAVLLIGGLYAVTAWALITGAGVDKAVALAGTDPQAFTPDLATTYVSDVAHDAVQVLLATSFFACVLTAHNVVARYLFTLGRQRALPARLGAVHPLHSSPYVSSVITSLVVAAGLAALTLAGLDPVTEIYAWLGGAGTLGLIVLLTMTSVAVVVHFRRSPVGTSLWKGTIAPGVAALCLGTVLVLVVRNFELLVGSRPMASFLLGLVGAAWVVGIAWGLTNRAGRPDDAPAVTGPTKTS